MLLSIPELIQQAGQNVRRIDAVTAYAESRNGESWFIDVREPAEVAAQSIPGSVNIPRGVLEMKMLEHCPNPDAPVFIHCATSARATLAAEQLQRIGYTQVSVISCPLDVIDKAQGECE
jgi:rhodanese-related sulfurtransferase